MNDKAKKESTTKRGNQSFDDIADHITKYGTAIEYILKLIPALAGIIVKVTAPQNFNLFLEWTLTVIIIAYPLASIIKIYTDHRKKEIEEKEQRKKEEEELSRRLTNPYLYAKTYKIYCEINEDKSGIRIDYITLVSLRDGVEDFKYYVHQLGNDGKPITSDFIVGAGLGKARIELPRQTQYIAKFKPLKKDDSHKIEVRSEIPDLSASRFISQDLNGTRECLSLTFELVFKNRKPLKEVRSYIYNKSTLSPVHASDPILPSKSIHENDVTYKWDVDSKMLEHNNEYQIYWEW